MRTFVTAWSAGIGGTVASGTTMGRGFSVIGPPSEA